MCSFKKRLGARACLPEALLPQASAAWLLLVAAHLWCAAITAGCNKDMPMEQIKPVELGWWCTKTFCCGCPACHNGMEEGCCIR